MGRQMGDEPAARGPTREENDLAALPHNLGMVQANDAGWPTFECKYVKYSRFKKVWWAYRRTYHAQVRDELVCHTLNDKCLAAAIMTVVGDAEELDEVWETLDTC